MDTQSSQNIIQLTDKPHREMPHNLQAEQNLLGAVLLDNNITDQFNDVLQPDYFYDPLHGRIFEAAMRLIGRGQLANPVTLRAYFEKDAAFTEDDPQQYLTDLVDGVISVSEAPSYGEIIYETYLRRQLIKVADQIAHEAGQASMEESATKQLEKAEQYLFNLAENDTLETGLRGFASVLQGTISMAETAANSDGHLSGVSTGLTDLNRLMGGMHRSDLLILAGRPGMGKTALATNMAFHAATTTRTGENAVPVAFFSLEMSAEQLGTRILAEQSELDSEGIRRGRLNTAEFSQLVEASTRISSAPFFIDDTPGLSVSQVASRARRLKRTHGLGLIVVDYLQLLGAQIGVRAENRVQEISNISRSLKALAKELDVPVLALSQLSRAVEQRDDKRPNLSDLRESGSIEQDADVVLFVFREEYYLNKGEPTQKETETSDKFAERYQRWREQLEAKNGKAEVIIAKQRHGPVGTVNVAFEARLTKFGDLAYDDQLPEDF